MKQSKVLLKSWQKRSLYLATALLWISGVLWLYYKYFGQLQGDYGAQANPAQPLLLEIHGAAAMAFLIIFGTLLIQHVPVGWEQKRQRSTGVLLLMISGLLIVTGWGLYYALGEGLRSGIHWIHSGVGLLLPLMIGLHVYWGKRELPTPAGGKRGSPGLDKSTPHFF